MFQPYVFRHLLLGLSGLCAFGASQSADGGDAINLTKGETFTFAADTSQGKSGALADNQGAIIQDALPHHQVVRVTDIGDCQGRRCVTLEVERDVPPPPEMANEKFSEKVVFSIDVVTGDVVQLTSTVSGGGSESTSTQQKFGRSVTISDFYGPWMLDVDENYKKSGGNAAITLSIETVGREKFQGHDCFQVRRTLASAGGKSVVRTYWIDVRRRVVLKVEEQGGPVLALTP